MNLLQKTQELCRLYGIRPQHSKGQNFLINESVYEKIIVASDLQPDDTVLEVGPGLGFLTEKLAKKVKRVVAVELDQKLAEVLQTKLLALGITNVEVVNQDILRINIESLKLGQYKIVANLPYNITSIFLRNFLESSQSPTSLTLLLQKEVVERIIATPPQMSVLAISVQFYAQAQLISLVSSADFYPAPEVESAIIKIDLNPRLLIKTEDIKRFFRLVKIGFSSKRKMLKNNLASGLKIPVLNVEKTLLDLGFNAKIRAQELGVVEWQKLFAKMTKFVL